MNSNFFSSYFEDHHSRPVAMVSRRKILSRSRDDLNLDDSFRPSKEEEDVWYAKEKLYTVSYSLWGLFSSKGYYCSSTAILDIKKPWATYLIDLPLQKKWKSATLTFFSFNIWICIPSLWPADSCTYCKIRHPLMRMIMLPWFVVIHFYCFLLDLHTVNQSFLPAKGVSEEI